jgi:hypothetical protein
MASLYALVSAGGAPGVTTTALALAFGWPAPVIVAECDPSGGSVLAGTMAGHLPGGPGLVEHAIEAGRNPIAAANRLAAQLVPLDGKRTRMLLPGLTDPRQAAGLSAAWPAVAGSLTAQPCDVIADCGRLDGGAGAPLAVISAASTVVMVLRPTLRQAWAARPRLEMLSALLGGTGRVVLLLIGAGTYPAKEIAGALDVEVAASLPDDPRSAAVLSDGERRRGRGGPGRLVTAATAAGQALRRKAAALTGDQAGAPPGALAATGLAETRLADTGLAENGRADPGLPTPDWGAGI